MENSEILKLNKMLCDLLWNAASEKLDFLLSNLSPKIIFPYYPEIGETRVSEQEARFLICSILNNFDKNIFYSVETPTRYKYSFSGKGERSAATDLTLYQYNGQFERILNIEFKAHNCKQSEINKDIEKLVTENIKGNWFHLLLNIDSVTISKLFEKFINAFSQEKLRNINRKNEIIFTFCVLNKKWMIQKILTPYDNVKEFFKIKYSIKKNQINMEESNGWEIYSNK